MKDFEGFLFGFRFWIFILDFASGFLFWIFIADFLILGWIGQNEVETPYVEVGQLSTIIYFGFFLVLVPGLGKLESMLMRVKTD